MYEPQHVLITRNGRERTSHVTTQKIIEAVGEISSNGYITIEKCKPVRLVHEAEYFAMSFYSDGRFAVYFRVRKTILRMVHRDVSCNAAAYMMTGFFKSAELPDMSAWTCEELKPAPRKAESSLSVDGQDFRHFDFSDVMAALENIIEGKSQWLLHDFSGHNGGYMNISSCRDAGETPMYQVEIVRWCEPEPLAYRTVVSDTDRLRNWLWDFALNRKYPDPTPEWNSFDATDYFRRLIFKFTDKGDKPDDNER